MTMSRKPLLVAAAATVLIGGGALAASAHTHHLQVRLPDGEIVQVAYVGDVAPRVVVQPVATGRVVAQDPFLAAGLPGFGQIDRIFADMARQHAAMMQRVAAMQRDMAAHAPVQVSTGPHAGNGGANWSYVSTTTTSNGCTQTVQWTSQGGAAQTAAAQGAQPQVVRTSSGNCDKAVKDTPVHPVAQVQAPAKALPGTTI